MGNKWKIYYANNLVVEGESKEDWLNAPNYGVQVVVVLSPPPEPKPDRFKTGYVVCGRTDCTFYTGVDWFDPLFFGAPKEGQLLSDEDYFNIWDIAYGNS